ECVANVGVAERLTDDRPSRLQRGPPDAGQGDEEQRCHVEHDHEHQCAPNGPAPSEVGATSRDGRGAHTSSLRRSSLAVTSTMTNDIANRMDAKAAASGGRN